MFATKCVLPVGIVLLSVSSYAQTGLSRGIQVAVEKKVVRSAQLPKMRDGLRNLLTRRLGINPVAVSSSLQETAGVKSQSVITSPTRSVLYFGKPLQIPQTQITEIPRIMGVRHNERKNGFYSVAKPGSGNIRDIALPAYALITQAAIAEFATSEDRKAYACMADKFDFGFKMSNNAEWQMTRITSKQVHDLVEHFKNQWEETFSKAYGGSGAPLSKGLIAALDVLDIQTWMLENEGKFPQPGSGPLESVLAWKANNLMEKIGKDASFATDRAVQGAVQHLVYLHAASAGMKPPTQVIASVLKYLDQGGRIPGISSIRVSAEEEQLTRELNYVEQLRRANLLRLVVPLQRTQEAVALHLQDFQEKGYIYQKMIKIIPEFSYNGTLNVPTRSVLAWQAALDQWQQQRKAAGLSSIPRAVITGRLGLPVNFNDLAPAEQEEVLLGTYLKVSK